MPMSYQVCFVFTDKGLPRNLSSRELICGKVDSVNESTVINLITSSNLPLIKYFGFVILIGQTNFEVANVNCVLS